MLWLLCWQWKTKGKTTGEEEQRAGRYLIHFSEVLLLWFDLLPQQPNPKLKGSSKSSCLSSSIYYFDGCSRCSAGDQSHTPPVSPSVPNQIRNVASSLQPFFNPLGQCLPYCTTRSCNGRPGVPSSTPTHPSTIPKQGVSKI